MTRRILITIGLIFLLIVPVTYIAASPNLTSVTTIDGNTISVIYHSAVPVTIDTPGYTASSDTVTYNGITYNAVDISNDSNPSGGVSNGNGRVNVTFDLNDDRPFCFEFYHPSSIDLTNIVLRVTIDGVTKTYSETASIWEWGSDVGHYIGYSDKYTSINALGNANDWIQSDSIINVQIQSTNGVLVYVPDSVTLKIVFKPTS